MPLKYHFEKMLMIVIVNHFCTFLLFNYDKNINPPMFFNAPI